MENNELIAGICMLFLILFLLVMHRLMIATERTPFIIRLVLLVPEYVEYIFNKKESDIIIGAAEDIINCPEAWEDSPWYNPFNTLEHSMLDFIERGGIRLYGRGKFTINDKRIKTNEYTKRKLIKAFKEREVLLKDKYGYLTLEEFKELQQYLKNYNNI